MEQPRRIKPVPVVGMSDGRIVGVTIFRNVEEGFGWFIRSLRAGPSSSTIRKASAKS